MCSSDLRSPDAMKDPVRMKTPASAAAGPTVGANSRGGVTADAIGWLEIGPMDSGGTGEGLYVGIRTQRTQTHTVLPRFRALVRR